jgi:hypothetical protein
MKDSLTYRQRNLLLLAGAFLLGAMAYFFSISATVSLWKENKLINKRLEEAYYAPENLKRLEAQLKNYNDLLKAYGSNALKEEYLLHQLAASCKKNAVVLASLAPPQLTVDKGFKIETRVVKLRGSFINLLWVVYHMEKVKPAGRLASVRFAVEEDRKSAVSYLFAYLYIQNLSVIE